MKQVLVADNHPMVLKFMSGIIKERGHEVLTAKDGLSALQLLDAHTPDVAFIDLVMPNIDGNKLCKIIRSRKALEHCFIVILSGIAVEERQKYSPEELGADLILAKGPFNKLEWHVDYIIKHVERERLDRLQGETIGVQNLFARQITQELLSSKKHHEMTANNMTEGLLELTRDGCITYANPAAMAIIGKSEVDILSADFARLFNKEDRERIQQSLSEIDQDLQEPVLDETLNLGSRSVSVKILPYLEEDQQYTLVVMLMDVTRQKQTEQELRKSREQYRLERNFLDNLIENSPDAIVIVDKHGRFTRGNNNAAKMFGYKFEEIEGKKAFDFHTDRTAMKKMLDLLRRQGYVQNYEVSFTCKDGASLPCAVSMSLLKNENHEIVGSLSIIRDLSEWKLTEEKLRYLSFHDALSGVYNRAFFEEEMERLGKDRHLPLGIIVCDINRLKRVNDTMGHQKGDALIQKAADVLKHSFRSSDIIARIGGDEFAVLLPRSNQGVLEACIKRVRDGLEKYNAQEVGPELSMAIGSAIKTDAPVDTKALFKIADDNMYVEKAKSGQTGNHLQ